jgi:hypothetical protein
MSKIKLLLDVVSDLHSLADSIQAIAGAIGKDDEHVDAKPSTPVSAPVKSEQPVITVEQIRAILAEKSQAGLSAEIRELLGRFGVARLSELAPDKYPALLKAAEELK